MSEKEIEAIMKTFEEWLRKKGIKAAHPQGSIWNTQHMLEFAVFAKGRK